MKQKQMLGKGKGKGKALMVKEMGLKSESWADSHFNKESKMTVILISKPVSCWLPIPIRP